MMTSSSCVCLLLFLSLLNLTINKLISLSYKLVKFIRNL